MRLDSYNGCHNFSVINSNSSNSVFTNCLFTLRSALPRKGGEAHCERCSHLFLGLAARSHEKHDRFAQELLEVINIYLNDCTLFFLTEKIILFSAIGPPPPGDPACTRYGVDEGGLCYYIYYICVIHLGAGPKSRPLPLISYHYYDNLRYHI